MPLKQRLDNPKAFNKMKTEEMFANIIKICAIDFLLEDGIVI